MNTWIITDTGELAEDVRTMLSLVALDCPASHVVRAEAVGPKFKALASCEGFIFLAVRRLESEHFDILRRLRVLADESTQIVVIASVHDHSTVLTAIRSGANDVLNADDNLQEELASFVTRTKSNQKQQQVPGSVISVLPCHSPSDSSHLAANLSATIAKRTGKCGLLDFNLHGGNLAVLLKLSPRYTILDLFSQEVAIDEAMLEQALTRHETGIQLLSGPLSITSSNNIRPQVCRQIISLAHRAHPFLIMNLEDVQFAERVQALADSDLILLTIRLDVASVHRAKQQIEYMTQHRIPPASIRVVATSVGHSGELTTASVKKMLQIPTLHCIADDPVAMTRSTNVGNPVVCEFPRAKISQSIFSLADALTGHTEAAPAPHMPIFGMKAAALLAFQSLPFCK